MKSRTIAKAKGAKAGICLVLSLLCLAGCSNPEPADSSSLPSSDVPSTYESVQTAEKLLSPLRLRLTKGIFSWSEVAHAKGYVISLNGVTYPETSDTSLDVLKDIQPGTGVLGVKALGDGGDYLDSDETTFEYTAHKLPTPEAAAEDNGAGFSWEEDSHASSYEISLDGGKSWSKAETNHFEPAGLGIYQIQVRARGEVSGTDFYLDSEASPLSESIGANVIVDENGHLSFVAVAGATSYDLYLDGTLVKENINQQSGEDVLPFLSKTGYYRFSVLAKHGDQTLERMDAAPYSSPVLNADEVYSFDNKPSIPRYSGKVSKFAFSVQDSVRKGEDGFALQADASGLAKDDVWASFNFDLSSRSDLTSRYDGAEKVSLSFRMDKPAGLSAEADQEYVPSNALPYLDFNTDWTQPAFNLSSPWAAPTPNLIRPVDGQTGKPIEKVKFGEWNELTYFFPDDPSAKALLKDHGMLFFGMSFGKASWVYQDANGNEDWSKSDSSDPALTGATVYLDDIYLGDQDFDPASEFSTYGYCASSGSSGQESAEADRIVLEMPGAIAGKKYNIDELKFKVMGAHGFPIYGNGAWERRLILTQTASTQESNDSTYALPEYDALADGRKASEIGGWCVSGYDSTLNSDGTYDLPSPTEEISWNKGTVVTAHEIGDTGKVGVCLLLRDFNAGEVVGVTAFSFSKAWEIEDESFLFSVTANGTAWVTQTVSYLPSGVSVSPSTSYHVAATFKVLKDDHTAITGSGWWGRRIDWKSGLYWLADPNQTNTDQYSNQCSYTKDGVTALPGVDDVMSFEFDTTTDANGQFTLDLFDFRSNEVLGIVSFAATVS